MPRVTIPSRSYSPVFLDNRYKDQYAVTVYHTCTVQVERFRTQEEAGRFQDKMANEGYTMFDARTPDETTEVPRFVRVKSDSLGWLVIDTFMAVDGAAAELVNIFPDTSYYRRRAKQYTAKLNEAEVSDV